MPSAREGGCLVLKWLSSLLTPTFLHFDTEIDKQERIINFHLATFCGGRELRSHKGRRLSVEYSCYSKPVGGIGLS
jgi:predicted RNA-binding Zn-ribbon protein involved in translation (DUF1610 family)